MIIFAYGSNMHTARLRARVSSAAPMGTGVTLGRRLGFHKRGLDGSGKADAFYTGREQDRVWGVLFEIDPAHKPLLDRHESLGVGYDDVSVEVLCGGDIISARMYVARSEMIDRRLKPFCWYHRFVLDGARLHGAPADYLEELARVEFDIDPDSKRRALHERLAGC